MLEKKKLISELLRVKASKAEIEYQIALKMEEIERLNATLVRQDLAELDLDNRINQLGDKK